MARMQKQLEMQRCVEEEAMKENSCHSNPRAGNKREAKLGEDSSQPITMRWYACTQWHTEDIAARFRDFIKERDQAYAAAAKASAKQERAAAAG
eukprot:2064489-Rhodomonas_salina.2